MLGCPAAALAVSGILQAFSYGKVLLGMGFGNWRGESGFAVGGSAIFNQSVAVKAGATLDDRGGKGVSAGIGIQF